MENSVNTLAHVHQEPVLPDNNEEVIQMLGLDGYVDSNTGKLVDDIVSKLDLDCYTLTPSGVPAAAIGFESIQGHPQIVGIPLGSAYEQTETISYVDLSPVSPQRFENSPQNSPYHISGGPPSPVPIPEIKSSPQSSPYHVPESPLFINETNSAPASPLEVSSFVTVPTTPGENQDDRKSNAGKTPRRRRELKPKLYQREEPLSDPEEEKKRMNAINAKKNRDKQKNRLQELENLVKSLTSERDALQTSNTKLKNKCDVFEKQLKTVCEQFNVPVIILPQD